MTDKSLIDRARALFESFHRRKPRGSQIIGIDSPRAPVVALEVGTAVSIGYRREGEDFYHEFKGKRPRLFVSADGAQLFIVGGTYTFTDRGIVG